METAGDHKLVQQCLEGNREAFEILVKKYQLPMYRTALGIVNDEDRAKDVTQTGFIKCWENLSTFNNKYKFYSWLYRIIINEALNNTRGAIRHSELSNNQASRDTPYLRLIKQEESKSIAGAVQSLSHDYKIVIQLRHFEELSYREIADVLDIDVKTVKSRLYTARMQLRDKLSFLKNG